MRPLCLCNFIFVLCVNIFPALLSLASFSAAIERKRFQKLQKRHFNCDVTLQPPQFATSKTVVQRAVACQKMRDCSSFTFDPSGLEKCSYCPAPNSTGVIFHAGGNRSQTYFAWAGRLKSPAPESSIPSPGTGHMGRLVLVRGTTPNP